MKLTKSMIYRPSVEARELYLFADNTYEIYARNLRPIFENLSRKMEKRIYEPMEAVKLYYYAMTAASYAE